MTYRELVTAIAAAFFVSACSQPQRATELQTHEATTVVGTWTGPYSELTIGQGGTFHLAATERDILRRRSSLKQTSKLFSTHGTYKLLTSERPLRIEFTEFVVFTSGRQSWAWDVVDRNGELVIVGDQGEVLRRNPEEVLPLTQADNIERHKNDLRTLLGFFEHEVTERDAVEAMLRVAREPDLDVIHQAMVEVGGSDPKYAP